MTQKNETNLPLSCVCYCSLSPYFDYERLARMAAFGFLFHGTISHFFYQGVSAPCWHTAAKLKRGYLPDMTNDVVPSCDQE